MSISLGHKKQNSLKSNAVHGAKWSAISQGGRQVSQWITMIILARILAPSDFGLVGMAMVITGFMNVFRDLGTSSAIIQKQALTDELLSSIFWVNLMVGILFMGVVFFGASLGGLLYRNPQVIPLLKVLSVSFLVSAFSLVHQALLERSLSFDALAKVFGAWYFSLSLRFLSHLCCSGSQAHGDPNGCCNGRISNLFVILV